MRPEYEPLTEVEQKQLTEAGYFIREGVLTASQREQLIADVEARFTIEGDAAGSEFRTEPTAQRLANLAGKGARFVELALHPIALAAVEAVVGQEFKLSSMNARTVHGEGGEQPYHVDMGALPDERGAWVCNVIWLLDDFTAANGATEVIPGSHLWNRLPDQTEAEGHTSATLLAGAGSMAVINAHLWHRGTINRVKRPRRAIHGFYCRRDKPQQQYQKRMVSEAVQRELTPQARWLLALDCAENDRLCLASYEKSGFMPES